MNKESQGISLIRLAHRLYMSMPLSEGTRQSHRRLLAKVLRQNEMQTISRLGFASNSALPSVVENTEITALSKRELPKTTTLVMIENASTGPHMRGVAAKTDLGLFENLIHLSIVLNDDRLTSPHDLDQLEGLAHAVDKDSSYIIFCKAGSIPSRNEILSLVNSASSLHGRFVVSTDRRTYTEEIRSSWGILHRALAIDSNCFLVPLSNLIEAPEQILKFIRGQEGTSNTSHSVQIWSSPSTKEIPKVLEKKNPLDFQGRWILVCDYEIPDPTSDAGSVTLFNAMLMFRDLEYGVAFLPVVGASMTSAKIRALAEVGVQVVKDINLEEFVKLHGAKFEAVYMFRPGTAQAVTRLFKAFGHKAKLIFHTVDLHFLRMLRQAELTGNRVLGKEAIEMRAVELDLIQSSDLSLVHSTEEKRLLADLGFDEKSIVVDPLVMDFPETSNPFTLRRNLLFIGGFSHKPNHDAVIYFANEVMPILRQFQLGAKLIVVGSNVDSKIAGLETDDVIVLGHVPNLQPILNTTRLAVAPLRFGAGVKGKVGLSLMSGLPTIATSIAIEGMGLKDEINVLVANDPIIFAEAIRKLYVNESQWNMLRENGILHANKEWSYQVGLSRMRANLLSLGLEVKSR